MQTRDRDNDNNKQAAEEKREFDLENIVGNLFIAEYQRQTSNLFSKFILWL
jgi:hypothetical protein